MLWGFRCSVFMPNLSVFLDVDGRIFEAIKFAQKNKLLFFDVSFLCIIFACPKRFVLDTVVFR